MSERVNIRRIAELAGCSASTVSRVLAGKTDVIKVSEKTRQTILTVCRDLDYLPNINAARFFSKESKVIGFIIPADISLEDDNLARSMNALYLRLRQTGYRFLPIVSDADFLRDKAYLTLFKRQEIDAALIWGHGADTAWMEEMRAAQMPFLLLTNRAAGFPCVSCDDEAGMRALTEHCRGGGAQRLACVTIPWGDCAERRKQGFLQAAGNASAQLFSAAGIGVEDGRRLVPDLLAYRPDAVLCCNDRLAIGVQQGFLAAGRQFPQDLLLTGADNIELSCYCPVPLTTFDQRAADCARRGAEILLEHLRQGTPLTSEVVKPIIIRRVSA